MQDHQLTFIDLALSRQALRFGRFTLKSGRESPYFFNAGLFSDGEAIAVLGRCYATAITSSGLVFDMLFGPAYKGIPLVAATAAALFEHHGRSVPYAFNRKEAKDHGEGGTLVGAPAAGRVVIVDDVLTAGTALREAVTLLRAQGANPVAAVIALDRQEVGPNGQSAVAEMARETSIRVISLVTVQDVLQYLSAQTADAGTIAAIRAYQTRYGVQS